MEEIKRMVYEQMECRSLTAEEELQLIKICEKEDAFVKEFSKEKWQEYYGKTKEDFIERYGKSYI